MKKRLLAAVALGIGLVCVGPLLAVLAHRPSGSRHALTVWFVLLVASLPGAAVLLIGALVAAFRRSFRAALLLAIMATALWGGLGLSLRIAQKACKQSWPRIAQRGAPLIAAIRAYEERHGRAPEDLTALVPGFIAEIPATGVGCHGSYRLRSFGREPAGRWALSVWLIPDWGPGTHVPMLIYWPGEDYQEEWPAGASPPQGWFVPLDSGWAYFQPND